MKVLPGNHPPAADPLPWGRTLFLDRDGTLMVDVGYPRAPEQVVLLPGVGAALRQCRAVGYRLVIVSNQSGVGRGYFSLAAVAAVHDRLLTLLAAEGATIDAGYYCPHAPEQGCACRKPEPLMLVQAAAQHGVELAQSLMLGDKAADVLCGQRAGCRSIWFQGQQQYGHVTGADFVVRDWPQAAEQVAALAPGHP